MKSVSIQYLLAIQKLKEKSFVPKRTIVLTFVPDEEIGGEDGMCALLEAKLWDLNDIAIALDEGLANPGPNYTLFYGERKAEWVVVRAEGPTGHGS